MPYLPSLHPASATEFVHEGAKEAMASTVKSDTGQLWGAQDWRLLADFDQRLCFPPEITTTNLRLDLMLWFPSLGKVYIMELTVPRDNAVEESYQRLSTLS